MTAKPLNDLLNWRYATKKMDPAKPVPQDKVDAIIEAIRLAPTSSGTQPFELFVVTNPDIRKQITEAAGGQAQITDGSHLLVFAAWDNYTADRIDAVVDLNVEARGDMPMQRANPTLLWALHCWLQPSKKSTAHRWKGLTPPRSMPFWG